MVRDGKILTPPLGASRAARHHARYGHYSWLTTLGIPVVETLIPRELLYIADEVFFSGTAAEITPIRSIDRIQVGKGTARSDHGEVSEGILRASSTARSPDRYGWLTPVAKDRGNTLGTGWGRKSSCGKPDLWPPPPRLTHWPGCTQNVLHSFLPRDRRP